MGGDHNFAVSQNGDIYGWGKNEQGQLGVSLGKDVNIPSKIDLKFLPKFGGKAHTFGTSSNFL